MAKQKSEELVKRSIGHLEEVTLPLLGTYGLGEMVG